MAPFGDCLALFFVGFTNARCPSGTSLQTCAFTKLTNKVGAPVSVVLLHECALLQRPPDDFDFRLSTCCSFIRVCLAVASLVYETFVCFDLRGCRTCPVVVDVPCARVLYAL